MLGVTLRLKAIGPPTINPITKVLQVLYAPPVLVPVLAVIALAHGWVYLVHGGVWRGVYETIYNPALTLLIGAILVVSATVHEFGHASALRYGGGKTRAIGVGMYLTDLAFYTDVTDSYRLGRWARVRTGLGGFYFDLIFALGLMALYLATGQEILLFVVFLINMELLFQLIPFVRLDGYWILADLTGVPDFFSQMGPFLRSVLPIGGWRGSELPNLKPWVKAVFAVYVLLVVPVLAILLFFLITYTPSIAVAIWDSSLTQAGRFSVALSEGSVLGMAAALSQYALLAIEIVGIVYLFYALGRIALKALWNWLNPRLRTA